MKTIKRILLLMFCLTIVTLHIDAQFVSPGIQAPNPIADTVVKIVSPGIQAPLQAEDPRPKNLSPGIFYPGPVEDGTGSGPYFGQSPPGTTPRRFAPSRIPLGAWGITFSPDGMECFITQTANNIAVLKTSRETGGAWADLVTASFSGTYWDMEPHITPDGKKMFFGSKRPLPGTAEDLHQWYVDKTDTGWSDPKPMDPPLRNIFMMFPSVAANGNIYFTAAPGYDQEVDGIAVSRYADGHYQEPELLSDSINYLYWAAHPFIAPDESYIIFDACTDQVNYTYDLFISFRKPDGSWTKAGKLPSSMTPGGCPFVSRDGKYFFFWKTNCTMWVDAGFIAQMKPRMGPYLGQTPPDSVPVRFGPPTLQATSKWFWHGSPSFSPDLSEMYFVKYFTASDKVQIYYMKMTDGIWSNPVRPSFGDTNYLENNPVFSTSGDTLYYFSLRPGGPYYYVVREKGDWSAPQALHIPYPDTMTPTWQFFIARSGRFYFDLWKEVGNIDMYYSDKVNGQYTDPVRFGPEINSPYMDWGATLDSAERILIFSSKRPGGSGLNDLYISYRGDDQWSVPKNLGDTINCANEDGFPRLSPDGKYLFFTSARNNDRGYNPYWVKARAVAPSLGIKNNERNSSGIRLEQNYPNPATGKTVIGFSLENSGNCRLSIYNLFGQEVKIVADKKMEAGKHRIEADISDLMPGLYLLTLRSGTRHCTRIMSVGKD